MYDMPTPREPKKRPSGCAVALVSIMLVATLAMLVWLGSEFADLPTEAEQRPNPTHDSMTVSWTYNGEAIRWYVMVDPDTGVQYVVNDRGGCCPRLDRNGDVMGVAPDGR